MELSRARGAVKVSPVLPPKKLRELKGSSIYLPVELWEKITEIVRASEEEAGPGEKGYNRNEVIIHLIQWATEEWDREQRSKKKK